MTFHISPPGISSDNGRDLPSGAILERTRAGISHPPSPIYHPLAAATALFCHFLLIGIDKFLSLGWVSVFPMLFTFKKNTAIDSLWSQEEWALNNKPK